MRNSVVDRGPDPEFNVAAYSEADEFYRSGRYRDALRLFKTAADADPSDGDAFHAVGSCYDALHKPARAAAAYTIALGLLPIGRHPALHFNIGNAYFDQGRYHEALSEYEKVPPGHPVSPAARKNARLALERMTNVG